MPLLYCSRSVSPIRKETSSVCTVRAVRFLSPCGRLSHAIDLVDWYLDLTRRPSAERSTDNTVQMMRRRRPS